MPSKKAKTTIRTKKTPTRSAQVMSAMDENPSARPPMKFSPALLAIPLVIALLALFLWKNKGLIVAATVDGQPIWRWNLEQVINDRYDSTTLAEMVDVQIVKSAAAKKGVTVSSAEVDQKISEIEKTLPKGMTLNDALAGQSLTYNEFRNRVELQIYAEKLTANTTVTDAEIASYIDQNKDSLPATDEASLKTQVRKTLLQQKQADAFQKMFNDFKRSAKVTKFL